MLFHKTSHIPKQEAPGQATRALINVDEIGQNYQISPIFATWLFSAKQHYGHKDL